MMFWIFLMLMALSDVHSVLVNISSSANWTRDGTTVAGQATGMSGSAIGYLNKNEGIFIADDDTLYIGDAGNNRIVKIQFNESNNIRTIGSGSGSNASQFNYPSGVFVTNSSIYVADASNYRIQKWTRNATNPITILNSSYIGYVYFVFVDKYENVYLSDCPNKKVMRLAPNSSVPVTVAGNGTSGATPTQLSCVLGIFVDDEKTLYIADYSNHRIQKWFNGASSGITVAGTGVCGSSFTQLCNPKWVILDANGNMYIADNGNHRIMRYAPGASSGDCIIACTGTSGIGSNQLNGPVGLAFDSAGSIYVSDLENSRVQKFSLVTNASQTTTTILTTTIRSSSTSAQGLPTNTIQLNISSTSRMLSTSTALVRLTTMAMDSASIKLVARWIVWNLVCICMWMQMRNE
ncbi:hypothetical protein I4U23_016175 [Adineta vaga]|nr:hypothetical protein I4U23_016175 [Adineta vaga]